MDELAEKLGLDPLEVRKKNEASPVRLAQYDLGAKEIGWARRNKKAGDMSTGGFGPAKGAKKRGLGMANGNWYVFASENYERPGEGPPRRLGGGDRRLPGHRHRLPHRDRGGGGRGAGRRDLRGHDAHRRHPVPRGARAPAAA